MKPEIINELETALNKTTELLSGFDDNQINHSHSKDNWSAAQVGQHLLKSTTGMDELLYAPSKPADRKPDEGAQKLKELFLNFEIKMKSPDFIVPEDKDYNKSELINALEDTNKKMLEAIKDTDLTEIAPLPEGHPLKGSTKLEIIHFVTYHTMRHNHQIQNIQRQA